MIVSDSYFLKPGQCKACGGTNLPVIDTQREIDAFGWEGRLYICAHCVGAMADMLGWSRPGMLEDLKSAYEAVCSERDELASRLEEAEKLVEGLTVFRQSRGRKTKQEVPA